MIITIYGDHFDAKSLKLDDNFFTELAGAEKHDFNGGGF